MGHEFTESNAMERYKAINDIQKKLEELLSEYLRKEAADEVGLDLKRANAVRQKAKELSREIAADLLEIAVDIDSRLEELLKDPNVLKMYEYNGKWFNPKTGWGFHRILDGRHSLTTLRDNLNSFINFSKTSRELIENILGVSRELLKEAKAVLENWKEHAKISVVMPEIIKEAAEAHITKKHEEEERDNAAPFPLADYEREYDKAIEEFLKNKMDNN